MKIYIELVILINFIIDFILLFGICILLRRQTNLKRIILSSLVGSITIIVNYYNISNYYLLFIKIFISLIMVIICFKYKNIKYTFKNLFYLYTLSIFLGGSMYLVSTSIIQKYSELSFLKNGVYSNLFVLVILSPLIIFIYVKEFKNIKTKYNNYYNIDIYFKIENNILKDVAFDGEACAISTSATSIMLKNIIGKTIEEIKIILDNYENMINEKEYNKEILRDLNAYDEIYLQPSRKTCALLPVKAIKKVLEKY